jgi:hypothetical protein
MKFLYSKINRDSEGDEYLANFYRREDGQKFIVGPGFALPVDEDESLIMPGSFDVPQVKNYTVTYEAKP